MRSQNLSSPYLIILFLILISSATSKVQNYLRRGSSLSVEDASDLITSPDNSFSCGFYRVGSSNAYWFAIWFTNARDRTVVWMANRDKPVNSQGSQISLGQNGAMVLTDIDGSIVWETNTTSTDVARAELHNTGNLVLKDPHGKILWQNFDFPTDTLLPSQSFTKSKKLISAMKNGSFASGYFSLLYDNDNVLRLIHDGPEISCQYWPNPDYDVYRNGRTNYNSSRIGLLDDMGGFQSSDRLHFNASVLGFGIKRWLTIDIDGNLGFISFYTEETSSKTGQGDQHDEQIEEEDQEAVGQCPLVTGVSLLLPAGSKVLHPDWGDTVSPTQSSNFDITTLSPSCWSLGEDDSLDPSHLSTFHQTPRLKDGEQGLFKSRGRPEDRKGKRDLRSLLREGT
ncbi:putative receptor protein kinase ZmPK1 [Cornus florida]|uniref:putative receptor protein kinase ZmPK1 n=1 Tax=Cornus florida TaxID=4283 RepID=UPI0028A02598|nr:putative receptor protein kinase ZmPK1 [Cornus florida]